MKKREQLIRTALGKDEADLVITGASVFNSFTGEFLIQDVLISAGYIAAVLPVSSSHKGKTVLDGSGAWLIPGFIDAHVHIESSMVSPIEFSRIIACNGVTSAIADPHEIANIFGVNGIKYMLDATENAAARILYMLPSCVPASPLEKAAQVLKASDIQAFLGHPRVLGLGEMMNFPGVFACDTDVMDKLNAIEEYGKEEFNSLKRLSIDGHAPFVFAEQLQAYAAAGIRSDHEASTVAEGIERLAAGMALMLREGSAAKNLLSLVPAVTPYTIDRCLLCTDDRQPPDLLNFGSINHLVKLLLEEGSIPLAGILRMASLNTAQHFSLRDTGAIAPGFRADFALYPDLESWKPTHVWVKGQLVAKEGQAIPLHLDVDDTYLRNSVVLQEGITKEVFTIEDKKRPVKVIGVIPGELITENLEIRLPAINGVLSSDPSNDIAKLAVFERHLGTGRVGLGFVKGMGIIQGAIASTVAHDSHNLIVLGMDDTSMMDAVNALRQSGGGLTVVTGKGDVYILPLELGGIFSDKPLNDVAHNFIALEEALKEVGIPEGRDPFSLLCFLSLAVIPHLKLTDGGLVDVSAFEMVSLYS